MKTFLIIILSLVAIWIVWSLFADSNLESPRYSVLDKRGGYEIRKYDSYIIAETTVKDSSNSSGNAFRELGGYIFGANTIDQEISMTVPVATQQESVSIAMTAPVATEQVNEMMTMSFMMPSEFTLENLPTPNSDKVSFREVPAGTFAVLRFSGLATNGRRISKTEKLNDLLRKDKITVSSGGQLLQYDQPIKFPWLRTNEIKIEVEI